MHALVCESQLAYGLLLQSYVHVHDINFFLNGITLPIRAH